MSFPTSRSAALVHATVAVDPELRPERVDRSITLDDNILCMSPAHHTHYALPSVFSCAHCLSLSAVCVRPRWCVVSSFAAADFQHLRVSVSSFMDILILATRTLATFNDSSAEYRQPQHVTEQHSSNAAG